MLRIIIPIGIAFITWRFVKRINKPIKTILVDVHETIKLTQLLLIDLQKTIETTNKTVQDIDNTVINADHVLVDVRSPMTQAIIAAEDTIHNIDNTIHVMQLRPIVNGIKTTSNKILDFLLCRSSDRKNN